MSFALSLLLVFSPIVEKIHLTDELVVKGTYYAQGDVVPDEGMLLSVEDFGLLQGHYLSLEPLWESRIEALKLANKEALHDVQFQCDARQADVARQLELTKTQLGLMETRAVSATRERDVLKWVALGTTILAGGALVYALRK
jgi:hypothetical protein